MAANEDKQHTHDDEDEERTPNIEDDDTATDDQGQSEAEDEWLVSCQCASAKGIASLLSCLVQPSNSTTSTTSTGTASSLPSSSSSSLTGSQCLTVFCNAQGITFHVQGNRSKQYQASIDIPAEWFTDYRVASAPPTVTQPAAEDEEEPVAAEASASGGEVRTHTKATPKEGQGAF